MMNKVFSSGVELDDDG